MNIVWDSVWTVTVFAALGSCIFLGLALGIFICTSNHDETEEWYDD